MVVSVGWLGQPAVLPWVSLVFGLCVGSFLNVVIHRLPKMLDREWRAQCAELAAEAPRVPARFHPQRYECMIHSVGLEEESDRGE